MSKKGRRHGTRSCYVGGCRRAECVEASREYEHAYWLQRKQYRRTDRKVSPERAIEHIQRLREAGMGRRTIAATCGLTVSAVFQIDHGERATILASTERRILAIQPATFYTDATGTARRFRALAALGHTQAAIGAAIGIHGRSVNLIASGNRTTVTTTTAEATKVAYARMSMELGPSASARSRAITKGWAPPLAWDDDAIDDPNAEPMGMRSKNQPGQGSDFDEWITLVQVGEDPERAAERCGITLIAIERRAWRCGRKDLAAIAARARKRWAA